MDLAKANINLKEGTIELEGPVEFVREYLDLYRPTITVGSGTPAATYATERVAKGIQRAARGRKARAGRRIPLANAIRAEVDAGFFNEPRSVSEVRQRLIEKGLGFSGHHLTINLKKLAEGDVLGREGLRKTLKYRRAGQSTA